MAQAGANAAVTFYPKSCPASFACPSCQHSVSVQFHDPDAFAEDEPIGGRNRWMQEAALEQAQRKLAEKAAKALPLVPCPKCGAVRSQAVRRAYLRAALPLLAVVPVVLPTLTMLFGVVLPSPRPVVALTALGVTTLLAAIIVLWGQRRLVGDARRSVRFP
jgi:predicted RNA-binding Zn-ribbon protein involved in translation (DUF1610 family)